MPKRERRGPARGGPREKPEYDQRMLDLRRTARVVAGGRRFSFRAVSVIGNRNGRVGLGTGKGADVASAIDKSVSAAKKRLIDIPLTETHSIPHETEGKFSSALVRLKPSGEGRGLVAGGPVRSIADLAGIKNLTAKIIGRTVNKLNNARATIEALKKLKMQNPKVKTTTQN